MLRLYCGYFCSVSRSMDMVINQATLKRDGVQDYVSLRATALCL